MKIINFEKKKIKLLTNELQESYENAKIYYIYKEKFENKYLKDQKYQVRDYWYYNGKYRRAVHSICNLKNSVSQKLHIIFYNGSNYDYHFIIKKLEEELKKISLV